MRRTQLYLDEQLWTALHARARQEGTTVSELVRRAVRERYIGSREQRLEAMQNFAGSRKLRSTIMTASEEVRRIRKGRRLDRFVD